MWFKGPATCQKSVNAKVTTGLVYLCQEVNCHIPFDVRPDDVN